MRNRFRKLVGGRQVGMGSDDDVDELDIEEPGAPSAGAPSAGAPSAGDDGERPSAGAPSAGDDGEHPRRKRKSRRLRAKQPEP